MNSMQKQIELSRRWDFRTFIVFGNRFVI